MDVKLNPEISSAPGEPSAAGPQRSEAAPQSAGGDHEVGGSSAASLDAAAIDPLKEASAALDDRDYATAQRLFAATGRKDVAEAIKDALAALDRKDYAKAQALFETLGQHGVAATRVKGSTPAGGPMGSVSLNEARDGAKAEEPFEALGQKDAAAAQAKGSALSSPMSPKPAAPAGAGGPLGSVSLNEARHKPVTLPPEVIPVADEAYRRPPPQAKKANSSRPRPFLRGAVVVLLAMLGVSAIYGSPLNWKLPTTKSEAIAGLSSAADVLKADLEAITGQSAREQERSALGGLNATLDQIKQESGARLDKLSERVDQDSSKYADIAARLDKLEKKAALPATPALESPDVVARLDKLEKRVAVAAAPASEVAGLTTRLDKLEKRVAVAAPASEIAGLTTRLNKLEKKAAIAGAGSANPLAPTAPRQPSLMAGAEPPVANEAAGPGDPGPLLRDYSVEDVRDGVAVVDSRSGSQEVAPGDSIPGAGRVLRIEQRGRDWVVLTSRGVIASSPAP